MKKKTAIFHNEESGQLTKQFACNEIIQRQNHLVSYKPNQQDIINNRRYIIPLMKSSGLAQHLNFYQAEDASMESLTRIHSEEYLENFAALSQSANNELGDYAVFSRGSYECAKKSAGMVIDAVDAVMSGSYENAYALTQASSHLSFADRPIGTSLLANIAIAIEAAKAKYGLQRIAVIDWHPIHGSGTQSTFYQRDDVLTISIHKADSSEASNSGPEHRGIGVGLGFNLNIPLTSQDGHETYQKVMDKQVAKAVNDFKPELIMVACGFDSQIAPKHLGKLTMSDNYKMLTQQVKALADFNCQGRLVIVQEDLEEGLDAPLCIHGVIEALIGVQHNVRSEFIQNCNHKNTSQ